MNAAPAAWSAAGWFQAEWDEMTPRDREDWEIRHRLAQRPVAVLEREQRHRDRQWTASREHNRGARFRAGSPRFRVPRRERCTRYFEVL